MARNIFNATRIISRSAERDETPARLLSVWGRLILFAFVLAGIFLLGLGLFFLGGFQLREIFLWLLVELIQTTLAAEFHGHALVHVHKRLAHATQFRILNQTSRQRISVVIRNRNLFAVAMVMAIVIMTIAVIVSVFGCFSAAQK